MFIVLIRTVVLYIVVITSMRLMGKKQIGELEPFEFAIAIMVSELASLPMQDTRIPIMHGIIPIITLLTLQTIVSVLELKNEKLRIFFSGKPSVVINAGQLNVKELEKERFNLNDLMEELRLQGYYNLEDIQYAILETSGQLSIIPKTELSPATKADLNLKPQQDILPVTLILDGRINSSNLKIINKDKHWLKQQLKKNNIDSHEHILIAMIDSKGKFYYQPKQQK
jgi:Predicted membrane protein